MNRRPEDFPLAVPDDELVGLLEIVFMEAPTPTNYEEVTALAFQLASVATSYSQDQDGR
jgi:hypothetical protein